MAKWYLYLDSTDSQVKAEIAPGAISYEYFQILSNNTDNRWLHYEGIPSSSNPLELPVNCTITAIKITATTAPAGSIFYLRALGNAVEDSVGNEVVDSSDNPVVSGDGYSDLASLSLVGATENELTGLNIAITPNDKLMAFVEGLTNFPVLRITISV